MDLKNVVLLEYSFLFEPSKIGWGNVYEFENQLLKYFTSLGMNPQPVKYIAGQNGKRMVYLSPEPMVKIAPPVKPKTPSQQMKNVMKGLTQKREK